MRLNIGSGVNKIDMCLAYLAQDLLVSVVEHFYFGIDLAEIANTKRLERERFVQIESSPLIVAATAAAATHARRRAFIRTMACLTQFRKQLSIDKQIINQFCCIFTIY